MKLSQIYENVNLNESENEGADTHRAPAAGNLGDLITVKQAAKILGVSPGRVRQFIMDGRLKSHKPDVGQRDNLLKKTDVTKFKGKERKITGRPEGSTEED